MTFQILFLCLYSKHLIYMENIVYVRIKPEDELPAEMLHVHVITRNKSDDESAKPQIKVAMYYNHDGIDWLISDSFEDTYVEYWLKPVELSTLIEEEVKEIKDSIDSFCESVRNNKNISNSDKQVAYSVISAIKISINK